MMLQLLIVVAIVAVLFGYKRLPALGRRAGETAGQLAETARGAVGDNFDPKAIGRQAGNGMREFNELKAGVLGSASSASSAKPEPATKTPDQSRSAG